MKLNLGSGTQYLKGWNNVDVTSAVHKKMPSGDVEQIKVDKVLDLGSFPWPFKNNSVMQVLASHILEHFDKATGKQFLEECYRVMAVGADLLLAVPDMDAFVDYHNTGDDTRLHLSDGGSYVWRDLNHFGGGDAREPKEELKHKYIYTFEHLAYLLTSIGFSEVVVRELDEKLDNETWSKFTLYVRATK